ncbi:MAG: hypothetical protein RR626_03660 [Anaerovoracaceae bacterium]
MRNKKTFTLALGGISLALSVIALYAASFVPGVELTLYLISSIFVGVMVVEAGPKGGFLLYVAASLLGFVLLPNKLAILPYVLFFGLYGLVKYYSERIKKRPLQYMVKGAMFLVVFVVLYFFTKGLFFQGADFGPVTPYLLGIGGLLGFFLYDYIYTLLIGFYLRKIKRQKTDFKLDWQVSQRQGEEAPQKEDTRAEKSSEDGKKG